MGYGGLAGEINMCIGKILRSYGFRILLSVGVTIVCLLLVYPLASKVMRPALVQFFFNNLSDVQRLEIYEHLTSLSGQLYDVVPEPLVARVGKRGLVTRYRDAEVRINNAGMRSSSDYQHKQEGVFRIICLGDSYVFGTGGKEQDRFCDQLEEFYRDKKIQAEGKTIETYALGLDSWTMAQGAAYLSSRISAYNPDLIIQLSVSNDITPLAGVNGMGMATYEFSPEIRQWGSGFFSNQAGRSFGERNFSALGWSLSLQGRREWIKAVSALGRLVELQHRRGGRILLSVLEYPFFTELYKWHLQHSDFKVPFLVTSLLASSDTRLRHDGHPNRRGNAYLASHYVHALDQLGWISVPPSNLPSLPKGLSLDFSPKPNEESLQKEREEFVSRYLRNYLDFGQLTREETRGFLGGIFPERGGVEALDGYPWASVRSGFLMRRLEDGQERRLILQIQIPSLPELFPFQLTVRAEGTVIASLTRREADPLGSYIVEGVLPRLESEELAREIVLTSNSYFTGISNSRMKSFRLVSAKLE